MSNPEPRPGCSPMLLEVPTTFTPEWVDAVAALNREFEGTGRRIDELYGAFQSSRFSSARPAKYLPSPTREQFADHVRGLRDRGVRFNYLLNAPSYANHEYTAEGRRELEDELRFLVDSGVASVTVAIPYIVDIVASRFPQLEVVVSTIGYVNSIRGLEQFANAGARRVIVDVEVNRDFTFLERAVRAGYAEIGVIANPVCIYQCNFKHSHYCVAAHGSQANGTPGHIGTPYNQYYLNWCFLQKLEKTDEFLKSPWIRPEDVPHWERIGIRHYKLAGRGSTEEHLERLSRAYLAQRFAGNLLDLLGWPHWLSFRKTADGRTLPPLDITLDNRELDGFLNFFVEKRPDCRNGCGDCNYCTLVGWKTVRVTEGGLLADYVTNMRAGLRELVDHVPTDEETSEAEARWRKEASKQAVGR